MKISDGGYIIESTGREIYANKGIIGINDSLEIFEGYDGQIGFWVEDEWEGLTTEEKRELAEFMISLWKKFANL